MSTTRKSKAPPANAIRSVVVVTKSGIEEGVRIASELGPWLSQRDIEVRYDRRTARALGRNDGVPRQALPSDADLVVSVGGDAAREFVIPTQSLGAGGILLFDEATLGFRPADTVSVVHAYPTMVCSFARNRSCGECTEYWSASFVTTTNAQPKVAAPRVRIC